jgi:hypothetical protein
MPYTREFLYQLPQKARAEQVARILDEYIKPKISHVLDSATHGSTSHFVECNKRLVDRITHGDISIDDIRAYLTKEFPDCVIEYRENQEIGRQGCRLIANGFHIDWT